MTVRDCTYVCLILEGHFPPLTKMSLIVCVCVLDMYMFPSIENGSRTLYILMTSLPFAEHRIIARADLWQARRRRAFRLSPRGRVLRRTWMTYVAAVSQLAHTFSFLVIELTCLKSQNSNITMLQIENMWHYTHWTWYSSQEVFKWSQVVFICAKFYSNDSDIAIMILKVIYHRCPWPYKGPPRLIFVFPENRYKKKGTIPIIFKIIARILRL